MLKKVDLSNLKFFFKTRPDTQLPQLRAGVRGQWRKSIGHLGAEKAHKRRKSK